MYNCVLFPVKFCMVCKSKVVYRIHEDDNRDRENAEENKSGEDKDERTVHKD